MKRVVIGALLLWVFGGVALAQDEAPLRDKWFDIGVGFQGIRYQNFDNLTEFSSIEERPFARLGYRHWLLKKVGVGFDLSYGKLYAENATQIFRQKVLDASFMIHYKFLDRPKFSVFGSTGFSLLDFQPDSGSEEILENASRASLPFQLNAAYHLTEKMKVILQTTYKKPISDLPDYFQVSLGVSFNLNKGKSEKKSVSDQARIERKRLKKNLESRPLDESKKEEESRMENYTSTSEPKVKYSNQPKVQETVVKDSIDLPGLSDKAKKQKLRYVPIEKSGVVEQLSSSDIKPELNNLTHTLPQGSIEFADNSEANKFNKPVFRNLKGVVNFSIKELELDTDFKIYGEPMLEFLDEIALILLENKTAQLNIRGYSDQRNNEDLSLPRTRVNAVKQYLINKGISDDRLNTKTLDSNWNSVTKRKNEKRVDLEVLFR